jgi:ribonuclease J
MADITSAIGGSIPNPAFTDVYAFITSATRYEDLKKYPQRIGKDRIAKRPFVMCVRTSMLRYLQGLSKKMDFQNGLLIYSFWSGYKETEDMKRFLSDCEAMGLKIVTLHTSGHADYETIKMLVDTVNPTEIIPIHTEVPEKMVFNEKT